MGKAAKVVKERTCILCKRVMATDSRRLKDHFRLCTRATKAGLVLPGLVVRPKVEIAGG